MSAKIRDYDEHPGAQAVNDDPRLWSKAARGEPSGDEDERKPDDDDRLQ